MSFEGHHNQSRENMQDGRFFERAAFGASHKKGPEKQRGYLGFKKSVEEVKKNYEDDPTDPEKRIANDLHALVAEELGLKDYSELRFYSALGSELDVLHGVDGFFEYKNKRATIDITMNPEKVSAKADVLLSANPDAENPKDTIPMDDLSHAAREIAILLKEDHGRKK